MIFNVSINGDFADTVTYPPSDYQGIILLHLRYHPEIMPQLMQRLIGYLSAHSSVDHYTSWTRSASVQL